MKTQATIDTVAAECVAVRLRLLNRVVTNVYDDALRPLFQKNEVQVAIDFGSRFAERARSAEGAQLLVITDATEPNTGTGRATYRGLVHVPKHLKHCKNNTECDALLINASSRTDTYPAITVRGTGNAVQHEASVSQVSSEQIFYMQQRGLTQAQAMSLSVNGFVNDLVRQFPMEYSVELKRLTAKLRRARVKSVAICFLHSYRNRANERAVAAALAGEAFYLCASHEISPEFREYERGSTTFINAYVGPLMETYLKQLSRARRYRIAIGPFSVFTNMKSPD